MCLHMQYLQGFRTYALNREKILVRLIILRYSYVQLVKRHGIQHYDLHLDVC